MTSDTKELWMFPSFEDFQHKNWIVYWYASEFMQMLGYDDLKTFVKVIDKATKTLSSLWIDIFDNIQKVEKDWSLDYKLTRYACYIIAMNWDNKKQEVALAQSYFAEQTRKFEILQQDTDRLPIRSELSDGNTSLWQTIAKRWITDYAKFHNQWYIWLYNMSNVKLAEKRNIDKKNLFDSMSRTELAANLFRVTQTEERIKNKNITWQDWLEKAHYDVWREVREFVLTNTWTRPENMIQEMPLKDVKKSLKQAHKALIKKDK